MKSEFSLHKLLIIFATSIGLPFLPIGGSEWVGCTNPCPADLPLIVSINPGTTQFTVIPVPAYSVAKARVKPTTASLEVTTCDLPIAPIWAERPPKLIILPQEFLGKNY